MDNRRYARFELLDYATLTTETGSESSSVVIVDVGLGGIQLRVKEDLAEGTKVTVAIQIDKEKNLAVAGEVLSCRPIDDSDLFGVGCRFLPKSHEERVAIAEYVHNVFQRQGEKLTQ